MRTPTPTRVVANESDAVVPFPNLYGGWAFVGGQPAVDGTLVFARIGSYQTPAVVVFDGRYSQLTVGPPGVSFIGRTITFHTVISDIEFQAVETVSFKYVILGATTEDLLNSLDLHFPPP